MTDAEDQIVTKQREADAALSSAIDLLHAAYGRTDDLGYLAKYVLVSERRTFDEDGDVSSTLYVNSLDGNVPLTDQMGLLAFGTEHLKLVLRADYYGDE